MSKRSFADEELTYPRKGYTMSMGPYKKLRRGPRKPLDVSPPAEQKIAGQMLDKG